MINNAVNERWVVDNVLITGTATSTTSPTLTTTPTVAFTTFSTPVGTPSAAQTYALSGSNLTADITVTAPAGYEIAQSVSTSTTTPGSYATTQTVTQSGGSASATIYVRLTGATAGTYSGNVTNESTGATPQSVAVTGGVPDLTVSATNLAAFSTSQGTASTYQTYTLTGTGMTSNATVTAPAGYQVAQSASTTTTAPGTFAGNLTVTPSSGSASVTIYVRLTGAAAGTYSGDVTNTATNATARNVAVSGTVAPPAPTLTASPTSRTGFTYVAGFGPSASQNFSLSGVNLTGAPSTITVTGSTNYEVSADNTSFGGTATVPYSSATLASITVYVRLKAGLAVGTYASETITATGGGAASAATVTVSGSVTAAPVLTVSPTSLSPFSTTQGTASAAQTYNLTGANLTSGVTVTAPAGYQIAQSAGTTTTSPGTYTTAATPTLTVTQSDATATNGRTIYVRLIGTTAGTYSNDVLNAATNAITQRVAVSGTVAPPAPSLTVSATTLPAFNTLVGAPSAAQSYTLTGSNLTADVTVTAPANFEVSTTSATTGFASSQTLPRTSGSVSATIYVHLTGVTAGTYNGDVVNASTGTTSRNVAVGGTVVNKPTGTPTISAGTPTTTSVTLTLGAADGTNLLVVVRPAGSTPIAPTDQTNYIANTTYGSGSALGAGYVVFAATSANTVTVTGLTNSTSYVADVYTYNVGTVSGFESYGANSSTSNTFTTLTPPPSPAGQLLLEENFDYASGTNLSQTAATGWIQQDATGTTPYVTTVSGNLTRYTYPQGASFATVNPVTSTRASMSGGSNAEDIYKVFTAAQPSGTSTLYAAMLLNLTAAQTGDYFFCFNTNTGSSNYGRIFARTATGGYQLGISVNGTVAGSTYGTTMSFNTPYLIVLKYDNTSGTDAVSLFILNNSTTAALPLTEPTPNIGPVSSSITSLSTLGAVLLRQAGSSSYPTLTLDNLRVASGWGSVIGQPVFTATGTVGAGSYYSLRVSGTGTRVTTAGNVAIEKALDLDGGVLATSNTNPVRLRYRAVVPPPSAPDDFQILVANGGTSYVDGPVAREVPSNSSPSLLFPVGRSGNYRPVTLNINQAPSNATLYTAVQTEASAYTADGTVNTPLDRVSRVRYFSITPSPVPSTGTFTGTVTLSFGSNDQVTDPSATSFVVAKSDGNGWNTIGRSNNSATTLTSAAFPDFSNFALASTDPSTNPNPLPVKLTSFAATRAAAGVQVVWATASEKNSDYFEVQRSLDGSTFASVAKVAAHGNTTQSHTYASLDGTAPASLLYYRLRQVDLDGTVAYSPVVTVAATNGATAEFTLTPNPARERVSFLTAAPMAYTLRNTLGQPVRSGTTAAGTNDLLVGELPTGVYFLELRGEAGRVVRKFIKE